MELRVVLFCTPGCVMNMYSLLENNFHLTRELVEQSFDCKLPRCTDCRLCFGGLGCGKHTSNPKPLDMVVHVRDLCIFGHMDR